MAPTVFGPENLHFARETDYRQMRESMIHGDKLVFTELIEKLAALQKRINSLKW